MNKNREGIPPMNLDVLCNALDTYFEIERFVENDWAELISEAERGALLRFLRPEFANGPWNGLMLDNPASTETIDRVYLAVFPSQDILDMIIAMEVERGAPGALLFTHHPLAYSERAASFSPIPTVQLEELHEHHISLYSCHAPLDCHPETSTASALAEALGLEDTKRFAKYYGGYAGIHGKLTGMDFQAFAELVAEVCELPHLRYDQVRNNGRMVEHIAIVPGGGGDIEVLGDAAVLGADTFMTGQWWLFGDSQFAVNERIRLTSYLTAFKLNLVGASHYSTEFIVLRDQMPDWFRQYNLDTILIRQEDPWQ